jgi:Rrf2 family iron-sulfur cluster assembly transcriptional regulator
MRIPTKCKIAVDAMIDIAAHTEKGYAISLPVICKRLNISHSYLELIFSKLKTAGLIYSHRGPGGGYSLARKPDDISVKDIVDATIDTQYLVSGLSAQLWTNLEKHMQNQMLQITLSHILANTPITIDPNLERLGAKLVKAQERSKCLAERPSKIPDSKKEKILGPNSVFTFGKFILQK